MNSLGNLTPFITKILGIFINLNAGCIKSGIKEIALKIAGLLITKWYGQNAGFIKKVLSTSYLSKFLDCKEIDFLTTNTVLNRITRIFEAKNLNCKSSVTNQGGIYMKHIKLFVFGYLIGVVISFLVIFFADPQVIDVEHQHATTLLQMMYLCLLVQFSEPL